MMHRSRPLIAVAAALILAGCAGETTQTLRAEGRQPVTRADGLTALAPTGGDAASLSASGAWVRAADRGRATSAFLTLRNASARDLVVTAATTDASPEVELRRATERQGRWTSRLQRNGLTVPAGGELRLRPRASRLTLARLERAVEPGDDVRVAVVLEDGSNLDVTATAR